MYNVTYLFTIDHYAIIKPDVVQNFRAINITAASARLVWQPPEHIEHNSDLIDTLVYEIHYTSGSSTGTYNTLNIIRLTKQTFYTLNDLLSKTDYNVSIRCKTRQSVGDDYLSDFISIIVTTEANKLEVYELKAQEYGLKIVNQTTESVVIEWQHPEPDSLDRITHYEIQYNNNTGIHNVTNCSLIHCVARIDHLTSLTTYMIQVRACSLTTCSQFASERRLVATLAVPVLNYTNVWYIIIATFLAITCTIIIIGLLCLSMIGHNNGHQQLRSPLIMLKEMGGQSSRLMRLYSRKNRDDNDDITLSTTRRGSNSRSGNEIRLPAIVEEEDSRSEWEEPDLSPSGSQSSTRAFIYVKPLTTSRRSSRVCLRLSSHESGGQVSLDSGIHDLDLGLPLNNNNNMVSVVQCSGTDMSSTNRPLDDTVRCLLSNCAFKSNPIYEQKIMDIE
ncbi:uncharacterized protein LOC128960080 [Oppia nitens]|uniref:uncharacterized protein LOC128960080 n=1 Tax=Oppia nitens TaxID=1686743 RepID=UPI0023DA133B|nr:uncharacterized protein LOC128960080 [Oppia nitens]